MSTVPVDQRDGFERLKQRIGEDLLGIWDLYVDPEKKYILYHPIGAITYGEVERSRLEIPRTGFFKLVATEIVHSELLDRTPGSGQVGSYRAIEWLSTDFAGQADVRLINEAKKFRERGSLWLCGGPRPKSAHE